MKTSKPYGSWRSPITSSLIVESSIKFGTVVLDGKDLYWNEIRPEEKGRSVIVLWKEGKCRDILNKSYNAGTRVHEYGGSAFTVHKGKIYFSNFQDQGFYVQNKKGTVEALIIEKTKRYANPIFDKKRNVLYAVEEEHRSEYDVIHRLVRIGKTVDTLCAGDDFYSMPVLHPNETHLAFISWNHPNMPWDGTKLWVGKLSDEGKLTNLKNIAGGKKESIFQPMWSSDGVLHYVSDRSGWWNIYQENDECLCPRKSEFGQPLWLFGMENYGFLNDGRIATVYTKQGTDYLGIIHPETKCLETLNLPFTSYESFKVSENILYFVAASPNEASVLAKYDPETKELQKIRKSKELHIDSEYISFPETVKFPTENGLTAYAFFYPPKNKNYEGIGKPPLMVRSHGGPSTKSSPILNFEIQFWTSRGFGVLDVNYGGSTGYGRAYRERLRGNWGIVDVNDCVNGALYLAKKGKIDRKKTVIKGKSAGGYTALASLTFKKVFKAGASYYGICDPEALVKNGTHKFEFNYLEGLIGPYPEEQERYVNLSPIHHIDRISAPIILFQGSKDKIVPKRQAEKMFEALNQKHIPVAYILFEDEQHGFRIAENIKKALDGELYFYGKIFGFIPSDDLEPITIHNLIIRL